MRDAVLFRLRTTAQGNEGEGRNEGGEGEATAHEVHLCREKMDPADLQNEGNCDRCSMHALPRCVSSGYRTANVSRRFSGESSGFSRGNRPDPRRDITFGKYGRQDGLVKAILWGYCGSMKQRLLLLLLLVACSASGQAPALPEYFTLPGCHDCEEILETVIHPTLGSDFILRDVLTPEGYERALAVSAAAGIQYPGTPFLAVGNRVLFGNDLSRENVLALRDEGSAGTIGDSDTVVLPRVSVWLVLAAGLLDGINPCALTTLLFLVSALAWGKNDRARIAVTGLSFTMGVFLFYLLTGFGLLRVVSWLASSPLAGGLKVVTAAAVLVLAGLSFRDAWLFSHGKAAQAALKLPKALQAFSHRVIRSRGRAWLTGASVFLLGMLLSALEFVCTGQVYLPTLVYMASRGYKGGLLLVLYNIAFILPLLGVFSLVMVGTAHARLVEWAQKNLVLVKVLLGVVFAGLGVMILI